MIELLNIDCMEYMAGLKDKEFDLAIVDPPYGIGMSTTGYAGGFAKTKKFYGVKQWDISSPNKDYFDEIIRVSKNQIIWGANHFISKIPYDSSCWIIWDKDVTGDFADGELAWTSFKTAVRKVKITWNGFRQTNMKSKEDRIHPTQKPVALYLWLLKNYAKPGHRILDTHLGSGSSAIAADSLGFDFVGCEIDKDYYCAAVKRFNEKAINSRVGVGIIQQPKISDIFGEI